MDELKRLLEAYDELLTTQVSLVTTSIKMYRGDTRSRDEITCSEGFFPKKNRDESTDYYNVIQHCIINGYGGPFISITSSKERAQEFASPKGYVYTIREGIQIIDFDSMVNHLDSHLKRIEAAIHNLETANPQISSQMDFISRKNQYVNYRKELNAAQSYHKAQEEDLVPKKISLSDICWDEM